jgi:hypothetical protein
LHHSYDSLGGLASAPKSQQAVAGNILPSLFFAIQMHVQQKNPTLVCEEVEISSG